VTAAVAGTKLTTPEDHSAPVVVSSALPMKSYPSIPGSWGQSFEALGNVHVFDKLDGSNLRFEVTRKKGLTKHGTRNCLFDASDKVFGGAIQVFEETLLDHVSQMVQDNKWDSVIVFGEF